MSFGVYAWPRKRSSGVSITPILALWTIICALLPAMTVPAAGGASAANADDSEPGTRNRPAAPASPASLRKSRRSNVVGVLGMGLLLGGDIARKVRRRRQDQRACTHRPRVVHPTRAAGRAVCACATIGARGANRRALQSGVSRKLNR